MTPEEKQAESVIAGLAGRLEFSCDCGKPHYVPTEKYESVTRTGWQPRRHIDCTCGRRHSWSSIACDCGARWEYGPRAGWRCVFRKHSLWKQREEALRARITELEATVAR
jgi:hypothetical protein